jgi:hypothetical protein
LAENLAFRRKCTAIGFSGGENDPLLVAESPEQILALIKAARK